MDKQKILDQLIDKLDELIEPKKWWAEGASDFAIKVFVNDGFKFLEKFSEGAAEEFLELAEKYLLNDAAGMIEEAADLLGELVKMLALAKYYHLLGK